MATVTGMVSAKVAVVKTGADLNAAVKRAIELAGGLSPVISAGDQILLKPNFVAPRHSSDGVTTDFEVIRAVADEVRRIGAVPFIYETPAIEFDKDKVYDILGVYEFARENGIEVAEGLGPFVTVPVPGGRILKSLQIPERLRNLKIINLPKLKTHVSARMTCGMKNLIGLLPDREKRRVHILGVHDVIADISKVIRPVFTVVDAGVCMHGDGPTYGDTIELGYVVAGMDTVSVDMVCSRMIGIPSEKTPDYILQSAQGRTLPSVELAGDPIDGLQPFRLPRERSLFQTAFRYLYLADTIWSRFSKRPLNKLLYSTGLVGTNPRILKDKCNLCGDCVAACPQGNAIQLERYRINHHVCIRCLTCFEVCREEAIAVKGVSRPWHPQATAARMRKADSRMQADPQKRRKSISVFFPALNEEGNIEKLTHELLDILRPSFEKGEVIIVDDGSRDRTGEIADRLAAENNGWVRVIHHATSKGYGNALKAGFDAAQYDLVFFTDGDRQFDVNDLYRALPLIDRYDLVVGYRLDRQDPRHRLFLSGGYNFLVRLLFGLKLEDVDCSFKLFTRAAVDKIGIESSGYFIDTEIMVKASRRGLRIKEIGVRHLPRTAGVSKVKMKHIYTTLHEIAVLWKRLRRGEEQRMARYESSAD
jgi:uncharacterized protein (DUF362 family)/ferredoxin